MMLILLGLAAWVYYKTAPPGIAEWMADSFKYKPIREFAIFYGLRIILPLYLLSGIIAWLMALGIGSLFDPSWFKRWQSKEAILLGFSALLFAHSLLWWEVPTTLWVIPGLRNLPFVITFLLLGMGSLAYPVYWLFKRKLAFLRKVGIFACWLACWTTMAYFPRWVAPPRPKVRNGNGQGVKVLMVGLDGLRSDVHLEHAHRLAGIPYRNAVTPLPATRLLWHVLWGGDPLFYSVGHVGPSTEEYENPRTLELLDKATKHLWRPRFYIDDGGTIGLAERVVPLDDHLMPAEGWENFVNSNLAASFPLYAIWENWLKPFPTTNPWAPLDAGLHEALRLGRGSQWVMFHSCLAHQPIFLHRNELVQTGRWWTLAPRRYLPLMSRSQATPKALAKADARTSPFQAYRIRMSSILAAWENTWNRLGEDPDYRNAVRVLFSDHGERFHHVAPGVQLQGVHGFNLDPWELRIAMQVAGPGFSNHKGEAPRNETVSLLGVRDGIEKLLDGKPFDSAFFEKVYPVAPSRYHSVDRSHFTDEPDEYRQISDKEIALESYIGGNGVWFTKYGKPASERAMDVSVSYFNDGNLTVVKPLKKGGAHRYSYENYELKEIVKITDEEQQIERQKVEALLPLFSKRKN